MWFVCCQVFVGEQDQTAHAKAASHVRLRVSFFTQLARPCTCRMPTHAPAQRLHALSIATAALLWRCITCRMQTGAMRWCMRWCMRDAGAVAVATNAQKPKSKPGWCVGSCKLMNNEDGTCVRSWSCLRCSCLCLGTCRRSCYC